MSVGPRSPHVPLPSPAARAAAQTVSLTPEAADDMARAARALPDPELLAEGTLVIVSGEVRAPRSLTRSVLAAFGRTRTVPRAVRCSALVARGYIHVGAGVDPDTRADLAWGYAGARNPHG